MYLNILDLYVPVLRLRQSLPLTVDGVLHVYLEEILGDKAQTQCVWHSREFSSTVFAVVAITFFSLECGLSYSS
jgi:hypothetical protein